MKIIHLCLSSPYNDNWGYQDNLLPLYQHKLGHDVTVITTNTMHGPAGQIVKTETGKYVLDNGLKIIRKERNSLINEKIGRVLGYTNIYEELCEIKPDFIMVHGLVSIVPFQVIQYQKKINTNSRIIADSHLDEFNHNNNGYKSKLLTCFFKLCNYIWIKHYSKVYGVTPWRTSYAHKTYGIPEKKLDTLLMGADDDKIDFENKDIIRNTIRRNHNIAQSDFMFISGGKIEKNKKIIETMIAFTRIKGDNFKFLIFGSVADELKEVFEKLFKSDKRIIYIGFIDADLIYDYFLSADLGMYPGSHSVLWEQAVACGLPCIFNKYVENGYVDIGGNCLMFENPTTETIYAAMRQVVENRELYNSMKNIAESEAREDFLYSKIAKKCLQ